MSATPHATIYHNPRCSTSRNALAMLREAGIEPTVIKYLETPPSRAELAQLIEDAGLKPSQAVRRREALFAELGLDAPDVTEDQILDAMAEHPILIERPIVVTGKGVRLARPIALVNELI
jgi:arsenate reductase